MIIKKLLKRIDDFITNIADNKIMHIINSK